jgi:hypothetical protein
MLLEGNTYIIRERKRTKPLRAGVSFGSCYPILLCLSSFYPTDRLKLTDAFPFGHIPTSTQSKKKFFLYTPRKVINEHRPFFLSGKFRGSLYSKAAVSYISSESVTGFSLFSFIIHFHVTVI